MKQLQGIAAARGIAIGPIFQFEQFDLRVEQRTVAQPAEEIQRLERAILTATAQVQETYINAKVRMAADQAAIFEAHRMMLEDPELLELIRRAIRERKVNAEFAVKEATEQFAQLLEGMENDYFKSRATDVRDIARQLLQILSGFDASHHNVLTQPSIIIARDLTPSETVLMNRDNVLGFCTVAGSTTSHTAILARGLGIPALVGSNEEILSLSNGARAILDGTSGQILIEPPDELIEKYLCIKTAMTTSTEKAIARCQEPAITLDGSHVEVLANIGSIDEAKTAIEKGAEGIGLLRTEFLFMERTTLPTEGEQYEAYSSILNVFAQLPVVLRTSDIGGDKELPFLDLAKEMNPFLGVRGLRLGLAHPEKLLKPQLRAALRAGKGHNLRIMLPMVATLAEIRQARSIFEQCKLELLQEGEQVCETLQIGIMVEVPSAALMTDILAPEVDFFSIGTNDLTQYTLAVDRTNSQLAYLADAFSPAVLRLIHNVIFHAHKCGKWVGLCGELAGEPLAIPILLGLGLDEFSMNPMAIPTAKQIMRNLKVSECRKLAEEVLTLEGADEVKTYVQQRMPPFED